MAKISKKIGFSLEWHSKNYKDVNILFFAALTLNFSIYTLLYIRIIFVILYACHFFKHINNFNYISYEIKTIVFFLVSFTINIKLMIIGKINIIPNV